MDVRCEALMPIGGATFRGEISHFCFISFLSDIWRLNFFSICRFVDILCSSKFLFELHGRHVCMFLVVHIANALHIHKREILKTRNAPGAHERRRTCAHSASELIVPRENLWFGSHPTIERSQLIATETGDRTHRNVSATATASRR